MPSTNPYPFEQYSNKIMRSFVALTRLFASVLLSVIVSDSVSADPFAVCDIKDYYVSPPTNKILCLHDNGHPYASIDVRISSENNKIYFLNPGPEINIDKITFMDDDLNWHTDQLVNIDAGDNYSKSLIQSTIRSLEQNEIVNKPTVTATPIDKRSVELNIFGKRPSSKFSLGGDYDGNHSKLSLSGKHFIQSPAPGFIDYDIRYNPTSADFAYSAGIPISYIAHRKIKLMASHAENEIIGSKIGVTEFYLRLGKPIYAQNFLDGTNFAIGKRNYNDQTEQSNFLTVQSHTNTEITNRAYLTQTNDLEIGEIPGNGKINTKLGISANFTITPKVIFRSQLRASLNAYQRNLEKHRKIYNDDFSYIRGYNSGEIGGNLKVGNSYGLDSLYIAKAELVKMQTIAEQKFSIGIHLSGALAQNEKAKRHFNSIGAFIEWDLGFGNIDIGVNRTTSHAKPVIQLRINNKLR